MHFFKYFCCVRWLLQFVSPYHLNASSWLNLSNLKNLKILVMMWKSHYIRLHVRFISIEMYLYVHISISCSRLPLADRINSNSLSLRLYGVNSSSITTRSNFHNSFSTVSKLIEEIVRTHDSLIFFFVYICDARRGDVSATKRPCTCAYGNRHCMLSFSVLYDDGYAVLWMLNVIRKTVFVDNAMRFTIFAWRVRRAMCVNVFVRSVVAR